MFSNSGLLPSKPTGAMLHPCHQLYCLALTWEPSWATCHFSRLAGVCLPAQLSAHTTLYPPLPGDTRPGEILSLPGEIHHTSHPLLEIIPDLPWSDEKWEFLQHLGGSVC